jgi:hypothetical protein
VQQALFDAEAIEGPFVGAWVAEVRSGGVDGFEQFLGRDLVDLSLVQAWAGDHAGDAVVFVAVVPGLDGAPGVLSWVVFLIEEGGDRTGAVGEGGLEMGEDVRLGSVFRRQFGRRAAPEECGADRALAVAELLPDALQGSVAQMAVAVANGGEDADGNGASEEAPQAGGGQAEAADCVGEPDGEGPPSAGPCLAVAAKDPPGAERLSVGFAVVKSVQKAVLNESADNLAVRARGQLEALGNGVPLLGVAVKPGLLVH